MLRMFEWNAVVFRIDRVWLKRSGLIDRRVEKR